MGNNFDHDRLYGAYRTCAKGSDMIFKPLFEYINSLMI